MCRKLEIVRGTNNTFCITVNDSTGAKYTLETGQSLVFGVHKDFLKVGTDAGDDARVLVKSITKNEDGDYILELLPEDTAELEPGRYFYDVGMQEGDDVFYNIIEASPFFIKTNITKLGDGGV